ncbi:MAG TPA: hypothetical protein VF821_31265 [Lentzea sp.]
MRFQAVVPTSRGTFAGVFGLVNGLAVQGRLDRAQHVFRRLNNDWYDANFTNPSNVDPEVYELPGAAAWFKASAVHLISRVPGYLAILDVHGIQWCRVESDDPGRIVYEDADQVVVVPH